jgi:tetratricopeptide (TPR) repeat protein
VKKRDDRSIISKRSALILRVMKGISIQNALRAVAEHQRAGRFGEAERICEQILQKQPRHLEALALLSILARQQGQFAVAAERAAEAARAHPQIAELHANLGEFSRLAGKREESIAAFGRAIQIKPLEPTFHNSLGTVFADGRQNESAVKAYQRAIQLKPDYADAWNNLGAALREMDRLDEAAKAIGTAIGLQPQLAGSYLNLAIVRTDQERFSEAIESYGRAIAVKPDFREAHWSLGMLHLLLGDMERGWPEYQWRPTSASRFAKPVWKGERLDGKTILLHAEQGLGDTIQFIRYVPLLSERGARVLLACQAELTRLLSGIVPVIAVGEALPAYDFHCAMLNLPMAFGTKPENIPASIPYLKAPEELAKNWLSRVRKKEAKLRVGLVWAGRSEHRDDVRRSLTLERLGPILKTPDVEFFSLQTGPAGRQAVSWAITDFTPDLHDFCDTAALIENLDLMITVDTAVAHLAGAMGKRVWVLLARIPDWRWMLERTDSPWYPTMRLMRQQVRSDWEGPIATAAAELSKLAKGE